ncbi:MAG: hypothetical protein ABIO70_24215 [Pseudomonadota bacterium]
MARPLTPSLALTLLACHPAQDTASPADPVGLIDASPLNPFPSMTLAAEDPSSATGWRLAIPEGLLPQSEDGAPMDVGRLNRLDGFSVAGTGVVLLPGVVLDRATLPSWHDPLAATAADSPVQLIDLASGARLPLFAEVDAHPDCVDGENCALLIRPLQAMAFATPHAFVLTDALRQADGGSVAAPEGFASLRDGAPAPGLEERAEDYEDLFARLGELGLAREHLVLAWEVVTGSDEVVHAPLEAVLEATTAALPPHPSLTPATTVVHAYDTDLGDPLNEHAWRVVEGTVTLPTFLGAEGAFDLGEDGLPSMLGEDEVRWMVFVPRSLRGAPAGSAPVVVFGHGLLASPSLYLLESEDPMAVQALADHLGAIFIATEWRGLCTRDLAAAAQVAGDFGTFHHLTDKMLQGLANAAVLPRLVRTRFAEADFLQADDGSGSLVDPERVTYFGISLGGIQGANLMALSEDLDYGVLHVGGAVWSTMLERSSNWPAFETMMEMGVPNPLDRQRLYAVSQLLWDPVDPITHTAALRGKPLLWQESLGDEQVPNLSTDALARSIGLTLLGPAVEPVPGLTEEHGPLAPGTTALAQFDPQLGRPHETNRPAEESGAHYFPRHTEQVHAQIGAFFLAGAEGTVVHTCGGDPCVLEQDDYVY